MTHPYEEMKEIKKLKKHYDMLGFVCDAQYGIPTRCPCGGEIMTNVSPTPKYKSDFDTLPGSRYFTCKNYELHGFTLSPLLNMTHPYEEIKEMKKLKKHYDMLGFVCDAQYGIPTRCPCGGEIMTNVSPTPKYKSDFDTLPGSRDIWLYSGYPWVKLCYTLGETVLYSGYLWVKLSYTLVETDLHSG
ncbi:hypothetical protein F2Q68_00009021 [Brassica cretica]|uniref:Uncharacterized protein n=1 Tax=Brassica cretica TaxID=69181 RepID=A0A8S9KZV5_BRACR|nr:hypothetical protein F2Q68_00009021 [Brassica cretica]